MALLVYVDGGARGNPGPAGAGVTISSDDGTLVHEGAYFLGKQTNNGAEYHALIRALQRIENYQTDNVTFFSDSELLVRQVTGVYRVKSPKLAMLFQQVQLLLLKIPCWSIQHVPREENIRADELANLAMDRRQDVIVFDEDSQRNTGDIPGGEVVTGHGDATPTADSTATSVAGSSKDHPRSARVALTRPPRNDCCPVGACACESFVVQHSLPEGLCIHAAHALVPTILAVLNTEPGEFDSVPTMTVRCMRPECGATFHVSPQRGSNGATQRHD